LYHFYGIYEFIATFCVIGTMAEWAGEAGIKVDICHGRRSSPFENSGDRTVSRKHCSPSLDNCKSAIVDNL